MEYYGENQLKVIEPYLSKTPKWLLLGGVADANEAQYAIGRWPKLKVVGVELNPHAVAWQNQHQWPPEAPLITAALWHTEGLQIPVGSISQDDLRHGLCYHPTVGDTPDTPASWAKSPTVTWDGLDQQYGPFEDAILWMDIEGSELEALWGARGILERGSILLINVELIQRHEQPDLFNRPTEVGEFLKTYGFEVAHEWNASEFCRDRIFVKR